MTAGGARPGAGRKKGATTRKTREVADKLFSSGALTPLEVILKAMQECYEAEDYERAAYFAEKAAPYMHPRPSSVEHKKPPIDLSKLTDDELEQLRELYRRAGALGAGDDRDGAAPAAGAPSPGSNGTRH
jgi:hypothetical protein